MLKQYFYKETTWQFEEGNQPEGAVEVAPKKVAPVQKAVEEPKNKAVSAPKNKAVKGSKK